MLKEKRIVEYIEFSMLLRVHYEGEGGSNTFQPKTIHFTKELLETTDKKVLKEAIEECAELWGKKASEKLEDITNG